MPSKMKHESKHNTKYSHHFTGKNEKKKKGAKIAKQPENK